MMLDISWPFQDEHLGAGPGAALRNPQGDHDL